MRNVVSSWKNPLPFQEHATAEVIICAYEDGWIPMKLASLAEAIGLYQKALLHGTEIFVFPSDLAPWSSYFHQRMRMLNERQLDCKLTPLPHG